MHTSKLRSPGQAHSSRPACPLLLLLSHAHHLAPRRLHLHTLTAKASSHTRPTSARLLHIILRHQVPPCLRASNPIHRSLDSKTTGDVVGFRNREGRDRRPSVPRPSRANVPNSLERLQTRAFARLRTRSLSVTNDMHRRANPEKQSPWRLLWSTCRLLLWKGREDRPPLSLHSNRSRTGRTADEVRHRARKQPQVVQADPIMLVKH